MKREFYCAGNWKMNKNPEQAAAFARQLRAETTGAVNLAELVILPPALLASAVATELRDSGLRWGGQNCYSELKGAFTGENSPATLKEMGASFCLVGHSERRQIFVESDEMLAKKVVACQNIGLIPILCVGETLDDRRWNRTQEVVLRQMRMGLQNADVTKPLWVAYEPVWAIGTGQVATPEQVDEVHTFLRKFLREWNTPASAAIPLLYGGSVKPENAAVLASLQDVNGFLVGGASLEVSDFLKIHANSRGI